MTEITERVVVLKEPNDLTFMGLNIFSHDFLHDFNTTKFSARLSKISSDIDKINAAIQTRTTTTGGHLGGEDPDPGEIEINDITSEDLITEGDIDNDFSQYFDNNYDIDIDKYKSLFTELNILENKSGAITRSRAALIQNIKNFIYETKLYVIGMMGNINTLKKGGKKDTTSTDFFIYFDFNYFSNKELVNKPNILTKIMDKTKNITTATTATTAIGKYYYSYNDIIDIIVQNGISDTIRKSETPSLTNYFIFMGELYLSLKNSKKNPFQTFNHPFIEDALFLYILNNKMNVEMDAKTVLEKIISIQKGGQKGGKNPSLDKMTQKKEDLQTTFPQLYNYYFLTADQEKDFDIENEFDDTILENLFKKINIYVIPSSFITQNKTNISLFTNKKIKDLKNEVKNKYLQYKGIQKTNRNYAKYKLNVINAMRNYIFDYLYNLINQEIDKQEVELNVSHGKLDSTQTNNVQMISVIVARGGLNYINNGLNSESLTNENEVLSRELKILENINNKEEVGGKIDENLKEEFFKYATRIAPERTFTSYNKIKQQISGKKIKVINNAVNKDALSAIGISNNTICPTSSVVDAMGFIGSCYGTNIKNKEYYPMNFRMTDLNGVNYYQGQTVLTSKSGKVKEVKEVKEVKVIFSALFNEFFLPNVEIDIDITTSTIVTLSANTTFKQVINKILNIWARVFDGNYAPNPQVMWQTLESKSLFTELVSNGAIKSVGDLYQEINSVVEMGGYSENIKDFYKYLRIGAMGDQPSGVRAGYLLLKASSGVNIKNSIAGYISPTDGNSVVISYNENQDTGRTSGGKRKTNKKQRKQRKQIRTRKI